MTSRDSHVDYRAKVWIFRAQAIVMGFLAFFGLTMGPLFLTGRMMKANGDPAEEAGLMLTLMGVAFALLFAQAIYNLWTRRLPVLRLRREGVEARMIGESSLDRIPLVPGLVRIVWLILSGQGFRSRVVRIPWSRFLTVEVVGFPGSRTLVLEWKIDTSRTETIAFRDAFLARPLNEIADAIRAHADGRSDASRLRGWDDQGLFLS